jgi:hypothetical protein
MIEAIVSETLRLRVAGCSAEGLARAFLADYGLRHHF